jgi:Carboxypeptidase regulatory-like domain
MSRRPSISLLALLVLVPALAQAQSAITVSGVVTTRDDGLPLPGATVAIESLNVSSTTDAEGRYRLEVPLARSPSLRDAASLGGRLPACSAGWVAAVPCGRLSTSDG